MRRTAVAVVAVVVSATLTGAVSAGARGLAAPATPAAVTSPDTAPALDDPTIVAIFDAANTQDIETGRLAAERGSTKEVRDFGAMLARDHAQVRQQGRDLAKKLGVTPTPPKDGQGARDHAAAMKRLGALSGTDFDRAFLQHEVAFHGAVIDAVGKTLLPAIKNDSVRALVVKVAPAFEAHRQAAKNLEQRIASAGR